MPTSYSYCTLTDDLDLGLRLNKEKTKLFGINMSPTTYIYIDDRALKNIIDTQGGTECDAIAREGTMRTVFIIPKKIWGTGGISKQMKLKI